MRWDTEAAWVGVTGLVLLAFLGWSWTVREGELTERCAGLSVELGREVAELVEPSCARVYFPSEEETGGG